MTQLLGYVERGWHIVPIWEVVTGDNGVRHCACSKGLRCSSPGKHPRTAHGVKDASNSAAQIKAWHEKWPDANWGVATGKISGFWALDSDPRNCTDIEGLTDFLDWLPTTLVAETGGGGWHHFFTYPDGQCIGNPKLSKGLGQEVKGAGGYVVLAGSMHLSGKRYDWQDADALIVAAPPVLTARVCALGSASGNGGSGQGGEPFDWDWALSAGAVPPGEQNWTLYRAACSLRARDVNDSEAKAKLRQVVAYFIDGDSNNPWTEEHADKMWEHVKRTRLAGPSALADWQVGYARFLSGGDQPSESTRKPSNGAGSELTDAGNALRFVAQHGDRVRWLLDDGEWRVWNGHMWKPCTDQEVMALARKTADSIAMEVEAARDRARQQIAKWYVQSQGVARLRAIADVAKSDPLVWAQSEDFDTNPFLVNFLNGTVDVRTEELREHDPQQHISKVAPHRFVADAKCPTWEGLVGRMTGNDPEVAEYLQRVLGYMLLGNNPEQRIFFLIGPPRSGKSKTVEIPFDLLGSGYAHIARVGLITRQKYGHHDSQTWSLRGKRYVCISETNAAMDLDESMVKNLTGADTMAMRRLYGAEEVPVRATWTLIVATNEAPNVERWDDAIARRIVVIPAGETIPLEEADDSIKQRIIDEEAEGVLAWLVRGGAAWWRHRDDDDGSGLLPPEAVTTATQRYAADNDHVTSFVLESCDIGEGLRVEASAVHRAFKHGRSTDAALGSRALYRRILSRFGDQGVTKDARSFYGLALKQPGENTLWSHGV